jgi:SAM-dependent methyltransferase
MTLKSEFIDLYKKHEPVYQKLKKEGFHGWGGSSFKDRMTGWKKNAERIISFVGNERGKLLELGCGNGEVTRMFAKLGFEAYGIEISDTAVSWAKELTMEALQVDFVAGDVCELDKIYNVHFNIIIDGNCLHCIHGSDRDRLLRAVYNRLVEGGVFIVNSLIAIPETECEASMVTDRELSRCFRTVEQLESEFTEAGFTICDSETRIKETYGHYFGILKKRV